MTSRTGFLLHHSLEESASRDPSQEAFRFHETAVTYEALAKRTDRLASVLRREGVRPGDRVGIYMTRGLELAVAVYGILKSGAAYVPLDATAPISRVRMVARDCGLRALVTNGGRAARAASLANEVPELRAVVGAAASTTVDQCRLITWDDVDGEQARLASVRVTEQDLAYVMYTSGSTGVPKGLMHTHASGLAYARQSARTYDVGPSDRLGNHSPLHFDMSTFEFLTGPWCGATTIIIPEETLMFPVSLGELIERERLTFWYSVPLALIQLVTRGDIARRDAGRLRWILFGGEPFPPRHLRRLMELWPHVRFANVYGPAELNQCTHFEVPPASVTDDEAVPIGRVWENAEHLIVDDVDREVPPGQPGELLVRSPTMMRGYWGRPDLNRSAFFVQEPHVGFSKSFYRTGDLVREREDGLLVFLGRRDRQVKVRGYRVELDEVEGVLAGIEGVSEAAAFTASDEHGSLVIAAAVLPAPDANVSADTLRRGAAQRLPPYAVPQRMEIRTSLPRTATGKIDRKALAEGG